MICLRRMIAEAGLKLEVMASKGQMVYYFPIFMPYSL